MSEKFIVETSARHVHLTAEAFAVLFGEGKELTVKKMLSQPGQFASEERVTIVGPKKELPNVSILGPFRSANQVELSATDARSIGIAAPIRESGDVAGSGACTIVGPAGQLEISEGVIVAKRHIHFTPEDAAKAGVKDKDIVWVRVETDGRKAILGDVVCRVSRTMQLQCTSIQTNPTPSAQAAIRWAKSSKWTNHIFCKSRKVRKKNGGC